jgi:ATP-dependent Clp protease ATP-binding subunit ClpC
MFFTKKRDSQTTDAQAQQAAPPQPVQQQQAIVDAPAPQDPVPAQNDQDQPKKSKLKGIDEYFSNQFRRILIAAASEAKESQAEDIDTEHLLLGLTTKEDPVIQKIFEELEINKEELEVEVRKKLKASKNPPEKAKFSPRSKTVLELSDRARREFRHHATSGEHMFLALVREGDGVAARLLKKMGIEDEKVTKSIEKIVGKGKETDSLSSNRRTPMLDQFGTDICEKAREGKIDPVVGRAEEIERTSQILARRRKNNPVLCGEPGVGKTAIVEGLAVKIVNGDVPETLKGKRIIEITMAGLMAGASKRGEFEQRVQGVLKEAAESAGEIILFIDEIHTIISSGDTGDVANIFKPALARGTLHCLGATTPAEYHQYIEKDAAMERRFQPVNVPEPSIDECFEIMQGIRDKYEAFHKVKISDEILELSIRMTSRYINDRFLPDKAVDLIDEAAAVAKMPSISAPQKIQRVQKEIDHLKGEREQAKKAINTQEIVRLEKLIKEKGEALSDLQEAYEEEKARAHDVIEEGHLMKVLSKWTGVPMSHMQSSESQKLLSLEDKIHERLIGQEEAVKAVAKAVRRGRSGLKKLNLPIGSFLFMGPTGVGKTEIAKTLANVLFGMEDAMIRFDMSEFQEKHAVARLLGPPPGYVGYEAGGELTEAVRKRPFSLILFDEVEKGHPDVYRLFLQLLDDGRLTDNHGRTVSFKNTIIVCTSNLGALEIAEFLAVGLPEDESDKKIKLKELKDKIMPEIMKFFKPEMINRFDELVFFEPISRENAIKIVEIFLNDTRRALREKKMTIELTDAAKEVIVGTGFDPAFGARPLKRAIRKLIDDPLSEHLIRGDFGENDHIVSDAELVKRNADGTNDMKLVFFKGVRGMKLEPQQEEQGQSTNSLEDRLLSPEEMEKAAEEEANTEAVSEEQQLGQDGDQIVQDNDAGAVQDGAQVAQEGEQAMQTDNEQTTQTVEEAKQVSATEAQQSTSSVDQQSPPEQEEESFEDKIFGDIE